MIRAHTSIAHAFSFVIEDSSRFDTNSFCVIFRNLRAMDVIRNVYRTNGVRGFYKGN